MMVIGKFTKSIKFAVVMSEKSAIIMGATSGIGREVAKILASSGWTLGICGRRKELLESFRAMYPQQVTVAEIDVCDESAGERLVALAQSLGVKMYLHCSGVGWQNGNLESVKELDTVRTNGEGFVRCVGAMFRYFSVSGGHIAVISSIAGTKGLGPAPAYSATKRMQNVYIDALEQLAHMRRLNITFSDIRPGFVDTALINGGKGYPMVLKKEVAAMIIVKAVLEKRRIKVVDWKYSLLVALWRCIPRFVWKRFPLRCNSGNSQ